MCSSWVESVKNIREHPPYPIPSVGVVLIHENRVLLIRRAKDPGLGEWSIPGGVIEVGETIKDAAERELKEECNLKCSILGIVGVSERIDRDSRGIRTHYIIFDLLAENPTGDLTPSEEEVMEAKWVPRKNLGKYLDEDTLTIVERGFERKFLPL